MFLCMVMQLPLFDPTFIPNMLDTGRKGGRYQKGTI